MTDEIDMSREAVERVINDPVRSLYLLNEEKLLLSTLLEAKEAAEAAGEQAKTLYHETLQRAVAAEAERDEAHIENEYLRQKYAGSFQERVQPWMMECFGPEISADKVERNHRFLEEALELVQANGCLQHEAHQLVEYVYGRDEGEINQEVGGVMVTLAALCLAVGEDMHAAGEKELARVWTKVEKIRAKQAAKPKHSPLPQAAPAPVSVGELRSHIARLTSAGDAFAAYMHPNEGEARAHHMRAYRKWEAAKQAALRARGATSS